MMVYTSLLILLYTLKSVANRTYICTYAKWDGGDIVHFILLTGSCCCITKRIALFLSFFVCVCVCACVSFSPFFTPLIHSQQLLFLLFSNLDIPPLPHSETFSPHYVSPADNTLKLIRSISPSSNLGTKDKGITLMFLDFYLLLED